MSEAPELSKELEAEIAPFIKKAEEFSDKSFKELMEVAIKIAEKVNEKKPETEPHPVRIFIGILAACAMSLLGHAHKMQMAYDPTTNDQEARDLFVRTFMDKLIDCAFNSGWITPDFIANSNAEAQELLNTNKMKSQPASHTVH